MTPNPAPTGGNHRETAKHNATVMPTGALCDRSVCWFKWNATIGLNPMVHLGAGRSLLLRRECAGAILRAAPEGSVTAGKEGYGGMVAQARPMD